MPGQFPPIASKLSFDWGLDQAAFGFEKGLQSHEIVPRSVDAKSKLEQHIKTTPQHLAGGRHVFLVFDENEHVSPWAI